MQSIGHNNFISPSTIGTSDAALLGILISYIVFGSQSLGFKLLFAFIFAFISTILLIQILNRLKLKEPIYVPLVGMMYGSIIASFSTFIAHQFDASQVLSSISLGTFTTMTKGRYELLWIIVIPLIISFIYATQFSLIRLGQDFALNLGLKVKQVVLIGLIIVSIVSASTFVTVGPLPFIGLIIPNLIRIYYGDNLKRSMFDIALFGSIYVLINDIISRLIIFPYEVSVGFTMGITGSIIFIWLIMRGRKYA